MHRASASHGSVSGSGDPCLLLTVAYFIHTADREKHVQKVIYEPLGSSPTLIYILVDRVDLIKPVSNVRPSARTSVRPKTFLRFQ